MSDLSTALVGVGITALGLVSTVLGIISFALIKYGPAYAKKVHELKSAQIEASIAQVAASHLAAMTTASDASVAAAEEIGRRDKLTGAQKASLASEIADRMTPPGMIVPSEVLQASVTKMRASMPSASMLPPLGSLSPGALLQVVSSTPPPAPTPLTDKLPAPARTPPWTEAEDAQTTRPRRP